jgi:hypothetical protein
MVWDAHNAGSFPDSLPVTEGTQVSLALTDDLRADVDNADQAVSILDR